MRVLAQLLALFALQMGALQPAPCRAEGRAGKGPAAPAGPRSVLPFSYDDYPAARARAQRESKILIVEAWATWCHTCQSMRSFVFPDPVLRAVADRFVYVALDTDRPVNMPFIERFPINSWPTMLALDPGRAANPLSDERVLARWTGAMTAPELLMRLQRLTMQSEGVDRLLEQADAAAADGRWDVAAPLYAAAAQQSVVDRPRALLGQIQALRERGDYNACADLVETSLAATGNGAAATDFAAYAASCLDHLDDADRRQRLRQGLRNYLVSLVHDPQAPLSVDDRSDGFGTLIELCDALGDRAAGDRHADARLRMLEAAANAARSPQEAATFDLHRLDSYRRLRRYAEAERMLIASVKALPGDFNAPTRLARLYYDMGRLEEALHYVNDALSKAYGPRRATLLELQANVRAALGQTREAVQSLLQAISVVESMPVRNEYKLALLRKQITAMQSILMSNAAKGPRSEGGPRPTPVPAQLQRPVAAAALPLSPVAGRRLAHQGRDGRLGAALHVLSEPVAAK
ncbi:MAG: thioredoxin family protein [Myxococcales bacterium]|nr:thioredoxin family protein [Myxococcales bacterium]